MNFKKHLLTAFFCGLLATNAIAAPVTQTGQVVNSDGSAQPLVPTTQFNQSCNSGTGGIVGQTYNGTVCGSPVQTPPYEPSSTQTPVLAASGNVANAAAIAALPAVTAKTNYVCGVDFTASGATASSVVTPTITGLLGGTLTYTFAAPTGATGLASPLMIRFSPCLAASTTNTAITATLPALGTGNTSANANIYGFYQ